MAAERRAARALPLALATLAVGIRAHVALTDHRTLVAAGVFQDDAFYYLVIARNWLAGLGPTFDGATATNAFHPMLLAFAAPVIAFGGTDLGAPIQGLGLILALFAGGSVLLVHRLVDGWVGGAAAGPVATWAAGVAASLVAISPYFVVHGANGQETGLAIFFGLALVRAEQRFVLSSARPKRLQAAGFGALSALGVLARVDTALLVAAIGTTWMIRAARRGVWKPAAARALLAAAVAIALWLPWGVTSRVATGAWLPTSGDASREIALNLGWVNLRPIWQPERTRSERLFDTRAVPAAWYADVASEQLFVMLLEQPLLAPFRLMSPFTVWPKLDRYAPYRAFVRSPALVLIVAVVSLAALRRALRRITAAYRPEPPSQAPTVWLYTVATFAAYTFYSPSHWSFARYECLPGMLLMAAGIAGVARALQSPRLRTLRWPSVASATLGAALMSFQAYQLVSFLDVRLRPGQSGGFLRAWDTLGAEIPSDSKVGAFQAGVYGWFSGRPIVNLDGKVNSDAYRALADGHLHTYVASSGIDYILDWEAVVHALLARHAPADAGTSLREVARQRGPTPVVLYRVERATFDLNQRP